MLNFRGRVERPSIKNFILEESVNGPDVVLFGKVNDNKFNFDVSSRISAYIAFALALSSFDSRLMCE
jgi:tubby-related protein 1